MGLNRNENEAILALKMLLDANPKQISKDVETVIQQVENKVNSIEIDVDIKKVSDIFKETKRLTKNLQNLNLSDIYKDIFSAISTKPIQEASEEISKIHKKLIALGNLKPEQLDLMSNFNSRDINKVLKQQEKISQLEADRQKKNLEYRKTLEKIDGRTVARIKQAYGSDESYKTSKDKSVLSNYAKQFGIDNNNKTAMAEVQKYSELVSLYDLLTKKKEKYINASNTKDVKTGVQTQKELLSVYKEIEVIQKNLSNKFGATNITSILPENFKQLTQYDVEGIITAYVDKAQNSIDVKINEAKAELNDIIQNKSDFYAGQEELKRSKSREKLKANTEKLRTTANESSNEIVDDIANVSKLGDIVKETSDDVTKLNDSLGHFVTDDTSNGLDLWKKSAENLKDEFGDLVKYAVSAEEALKNFNKLGNSIENQEIEKGSQKWKDFMGYGQRLLSLDETSLDENQYADFFWINESDYEKFSDKIDSMTQKQLQEMKKLEDVQNEIVQESENLDKKLEESLDVGTSTEDLKELLNILKDFIDKLGTEDLVKNIFGDNEDLKRSFLNVSEEFEKSLNNILENFSKKLNEVIPDEKEIKIKVVDYSSLPLLTDESGNPLTVYRGVRDTIGGFVSNDQNGLNYFSTIKEVAESYIKDGGKLITANIGMKNPLELDVKGSHWDNITYIGEGFDETSKKLWELENSIKQYQEQLKTVKKDSIEFKEVTDKLNSAIAEQNTILNDSSNPYVKNVTTDDFADKVKSSGLYDGLILKNIIDGGGITATDVIAFDEQQIKNIKTLSNELQDVQGKEHTQEINSEISNLDSLTQELFDIIEAIDAKNNAFEEEAIIVEKSVSREINKLQELKDLLIDITDRVKNKNSEMDHMIQDGIEISNNSEQSKGSKKNPENPRVLPASTQYNKDVLANYKNLIASLSEYYKLRERVAAGKLLPGDKERLEELTLSFEKAEKGLEEFMIDRNGSKGSIDAVEKEQKRLFENQKDMYKNSIDVYVNGVNNTLSKIKPEKYTEEYNNQLKDITHLIEDLQSKLPIDILTDEDVSEKLSEIYNIKSKIDNILDGRNDKQYKFANESDVYKLQADLYELMQRNSGMVSTLKKQFTDLGNEIESHKGKMPQEELERFRKEFQRLRSEMEKSDKVGKSFWGKVKDKMIYGWADIAAQYLGLQDIIRYIQQLGQAVTKYNTNLTEMRKVSDETVKTLKEFQKTSFDLADDIGATADAIQNSTADFMRLGYELEDADDLAVDANIYANVGDMEIGEATEHMISSIQAWKSEFSSEVEASAAIIDRYNEIGNNFAITSADIGSAMERSAAALKAGGNTLNESLGLITAGNLIQQDADTTANALKVVSLRIRGSKAELEEMGESVDDLADSSSKCREELKALTGVDIMLDENTYKSTAQIIQEIGENWTKLSDVSQAATLELLAGKTRASVMAGLIENYEVIEDVIEAAENAEGSALRENERYLESIEGHIAVLSNAWDKFVTSLIDSGTINFFLDLATAVVNLGEKLINLTSPLGMLASIGAGAASLHGLGLTNYVTYHSLRVPFYKIA